MRSSSSIFSTPGQQPIARSRPRRPAWLPTTLASLLPEPRTRTGLRLQDARGPQYADDVGTRAIADAEADVGGSRSRRGGIDFELLPEAARAHLDLRADGRAVADARRQLDAQRTRRAGGHRRCATRRGRLARERRCRYGRRRSTSPAASAVASANAAAISGRMARADTSVHSRPRLRMQPRAAERSAGRGRAGRRCRSR